MSDVGRAGGVEAAERSDTVRDGLRAREGVGIVVVVVADVGGISSEDDARAFIVSMAGPADTVDGVCCCSATSGLLLSPMRAGCDVLFAQKTLGCFL